MCCLQLPPRFGYPLVLFHHTRFLLKIVQVVTYPKHWPQCMWTFTINANTHCQGSQLQKRLNALSVLIVCTHHIVMQKISYYYINVEIYVLDTMAQIMIHSPENLQRRLYLSIKNGQHL